MVSRCILYLINLYFILYWPCCVNESFDYLFNFLIEFISLISSNSYIGV